MSAILAPGIETIVRAFVPSVQSVPPITLDRLFVAADLTSKRYAFQLAVSR